MRFSSMRDMLEKYQPYLLTETDLPQMCAQLIDWAHINSGTENIEGVEKMCIQLEEALTGIAQTKKRHSLNEAKPYGSVLQACCRPHAPIQILLSGHTDTVYGKEHPFQGCERLDENRLRGPGVLDMKGGLLVMVNALRLFEQSPFRDKIGWEVLITPNEEVGSQGMDPFFEAAAQRCHFGLVFEPTRPDGTLVRNRKGTRNIEIMVHGCSAHVGRAFEEGTNAIVELARLVEQIDALNRYLPGVIINIGQIEGGGPLNVVPDRACVRINVRFSTQKQLEEFEERMAALIAAANQKEQVKVEYLGKTIRPSKEVDVQVEALFTRVQECGSMLGMEFGWQDTGGGSDGNNLLAAGLPNIDTMGVQGDHLHSPQEFVYLPSLIERTNLVLLFFMHVAEEGIGELRL